MPVRLIRTVEWLPAASAPIGEKVLVWGNGPPRIAILDGLGQWRKIWGGPGTPPKFWMPIPDGPSEDELASGPTDEVV